MVAHPYRCCSQPTPSPMAYLRPLGRGGIGRGLTPWGYAGNAPSQQVGRARGAPIFFGRGTHTVPQRTPCFPLYGQDDSPPHPFLGGFSRETPPHTTPVEVDTTLSAKPWRDPWARGPTQIRNETDGERRQRITSWVNQADSVISSTTSPHHSDCGDNINTNESSSN